MKKIKHLTVRVVRTSGGNRAINGEDFIEGIVILEKNSKNLIRFPDKIQSSIHQSEKIKVKIGRNKTIKINEMLYQFSDQETTEEKLVTFNNCHTLIKEEFTVRKSFLKNNNNNLTVHEIMQLKDFLSKYKKAFKKSHKIESDLMFERIKKIYLKGYDLIWIKIDLEG
jgi:hypothetical protein